jgi:translocation and assembly module TamA
MRIKIVLLAAILVTFCFAEVKENKEKIYTLNITGLKNLDSDDLAKALGVKDSGFLFFGKKNQISQKFLDSLEPTLKGYLESHGYFKAKYNIEKYEDNITIKIKEGKPVVVTQINIDSDLKIKDLITFKKGDIFVSEKFSDIKDAIKKRVLNNGYCKYKLDTKAYIDLDNYSAKLDYKLKKGEICHFGDVKINKPKNIKLRVIKSRLKFKKGDKFSLKAIEDSYEALNRLNTFANINIAYDLEENNTKVDSEVSLDIKQKLKRYSVALGVDSEIGFRAKALWEKRNFLGNAKKFLVKTQLSKNIQSFEVLLFTPALIDFYDIYLDSYVSGGYSIEKTDGYKEKKVFANAYLEYNDNSLKVQTGIGIENLQIDLYENIPSIIGGTFNLLYPYVNIVYDKRDSKIDPKNGYYLNLYTEYGIGRKSGGVQYLKYFFEARAIKSFGDLTLSAVGKIGSIHEVSGKLPASKLFYGGGLFSNRAYGKNDIGIVTSPISFLGLGGKSYLNLQLEANYKIYKKLYGAIFFDSTIINEQEYKFRGDRIDTIGFGLRYKTPIGPIKIDVGFNVHNKKDYAISIMLGQSF